MNGKIYHIYNRGVDGRTIFIDDEDYKKLADACAELADAQLYIDDTSTLTPLEIRAKARRLKAMYNIKCIVINPVILADL